MKVQVEDISRELLDDLEEQWEQTRLKNLVRDEVTKLAGRYHAALEQAERLEGHCWIRARKLAMLGFPNHEIAELFGVRVRQVNQWTKGIQ